MDDHDCNQKEKIDLILKNQRDLSVDIKDAITGLTKIVMADIALRKDVEHAKKDLALLFTQTRSGAKRVEALEKINAQFEGSKIYDNFPKVWNWYQEEKGYRRLFPAAMAAGSFVILIYVTFT